MARPIRALGGAARRVSAGDYAAELAVLDRALRHAAGESILHGWRGDALRLLGREEEARAALERALRIDPGYTWAWDTLVELCRRRGEPGRPLALAEAIAAERPHESRAWVLVARARKARGLSQTELAEKIGSIQALVSDYERGNVRLSAEMTIRFAEALGISTDELLGVKPAKMKDEMSLRLTRRLKGIEALPAAQQKALLQTIDAFLKSTG